MLTNIIIIDKTILKVKNRSNIHGGKGSTIIDKIINNKIGPDNTFQEIELEFFSFLILFFNLKKLNIGLTLFFYKNLYNK